MLVSKPRTRRSTSTYDEEIGIARPGCQKCTQFDHLNYVYLGSERSVQDQEDGVATNSSVF